MARFVKGFVGLLLASLAILLLWGSLVEPYLLDLEEETAVIPQLPPGWQGRQVGVVGDFQVGMWGDNEATVRKAIDRLVELHPDLVLLLGDFVYHAPGNHENDIQMVVQMVAPLTEAGIPTYAVLGNHDYQVNEVGEAPNTALANRLEAALEAHGIQVLHDEAVMLPKHAGDEAALYLVGIDAHQPKLDSPSDAFAGLSRSMPRLVLMHNPASFADIPAGAAPLAVAGHTHGGQIRIPFTPQWSYLTFVESEPVHVDGWIRDYGAPENHLYVNRGIGFSILPIRINCVPEVTLFTLQAP